jgi:hypothetical protein
LPLEASGFDDLTLLKYQQESPGTGLRACPYVDLHLWEACDGDAVAVSIAVASAPDGLLHHHDFVLGASKVTDQGFLGVEAHAAGRAVKG